MNTPAQFCERSTAAKKRFKNLLHKPMILNSPLHLVVRNVFQLIPNFPLGVSATQHIFFYLEWPKGIVSIPVGQPDPTRPISLTLTPPTPADRVVPIHGWRLVIVLCGLILCASLVRFCLWCVPNLRSRDPWQWAGFCKQRFFAAVDRSQNCAGVFTGAHISIQIELL